MRKTLFTLFLVLAASVGTLFAESGTCGENLTWDLTGGVLTISGTGTMTDYTYSDHAPWYDNRESITSVTIENGVTSIGERAFSSCSSLTSVTIPNSVTSIGERAFSSCWSLTSITIPNSVTSIGKYAFNNCSSLTAVTIPNSVTSIGEYAFSSGKLTSIDVASDNPNYCSVDGVLFNKDKTELIQYPRGNARIEYTIPNSVTSIGGGAFEGCSSLTSITIPSSVTSIGNYAFMECSSLTSVTIPSSVISIGYTAFNNCSSLTSVTIPNSVTSIENYTFQSCSSLTSVEIPNSVTSIGYGAFAYCRGLTSITCEATTPPTCEDDAFNNVPKTIPVYVPAASVDDYKAADQWKDFGENIQAIIPNTCGENLTWDLTGGVLTISGTGAMTDYTGGETPWFDYRSSITSVIIENGVTSIGWTAFLECTNLTSVTIPNSVTSIGYRAFSNCMSLTSITIPNSVTSIDDNAFILCDGLTSITCEATTPPTCGIAVFLSVPKTIPVYVPALSVDDYKAADGWKDFGENIQAIPTQTKTKSMTPGIVYLKWIEAKNQWGATVYDDQFNPGFVFSLVWAGNKTDIPTTIKYTLEKEDDNNVFAEVGNENYGGYAKNVDLVITTDGKGLRTKEEGGSTVLYIRAKISGEISSAEGDKMIVNAPADFIDVQIEGIEIPTALDKITNDQSPITNKIIKDNQIFILRGEKAFTLTGQEIK